MKREDIKENKITKKMFWPVVATVALLFNLALSSVFTASGETYFYINIPDYVNTIGSKEKQIHDRIKSLTQFHIQNLDKDFLFS